MPLSDVILPHRLFASKALKKEADRTRQRVNELRQQYEDAVEQRNASIAIEQKKLTEKEAAVRQSLLCALESEAEILQSLQERLEEYVAMYFHREMLYSLLRLYEDEVRRYDESIAIINNLKQENETEIRLYKDRYSLLLTQAKVDDIIALLRLSDAGIEVADNTSAPQLLNQLGILAKGASDAEESIIHRQTINRLRSLTQERVGFSNELQYVSWYISLKIGFSRNLVSIINDYRTQKSKIIAQINKTKSEACDLTAKLKEAARLIREYWTRPLAFIEVDIWWSKARRFEVIAQLQSLNTELSSVRAAKRKSISEKREMQQAHSSDDTKWRRIKSDIENHTSQENTLKLRQARLETQKRAIDTDLDQFGRDQGLWLGRSKAIKAAFQQNSVWFNTNASTYSNEIERIVSERITAIVTLSEQSAIEARHQREIEVQKHMAAKESLISELIKEKGKIDDRLADLHRRLSGLRIGYDEARATDKKVLWGWLIPSSNSRIIRDEMREIEQAILSDTEASAAINRKIEGTRTRYEAIIAQCTVQPLHPTDEEQAELSKLQAWASRSPNGGKRE